MSNYYCLIAGLPEILFSDKPKESKLYRFITDIKDEVSVKDYELIKLFLLKYDNQNLLSFLNNPEAEFNNLGNFTKEDYQEIIQKFKDQEPISEPKIPKYIQKFIIQKLTSEKTEATETIFEEDYLSSLYFNYISKSKNKLITTWFEFDLNLNNILTSLNCRKHNLDKKNLIVGNNEISKILRTSHSKDFDLTGIFEQLDKIVKISEDEDFFEREQKIDILRWEFLQDQTFFNYFEIEKIFAYTIMLETIDRWSKLTTEKGNKIFREFIDKLQDSFEFSPIFLLNKK